MNNIVRHIQNGSGVTQGQASSWSEPWLLRYRGLQLREQRLIQAAAVLLPLMILVFGIALPLQNRQKALQAELATMQHQAVEAEQLAEQLMAADTKQQNGKPANLMTAVERLARQGKVREYMTRIRPQVSTGSQNQSLMLQLKNIPYKAAIGFVDAIAHERLGLSSIKIQAGKSAGLVHLQAVVSSR
jgi:type II secretory pathway component PulM